MDRKNKIKQFLTKLMNNRDLKDDEDIFALGFLNSLAAVQLVNFLEKEFGIAIEDEDLNVENFSTLNNMNELLERKLASHAKV